MSRGWQKSTLTPPRPCGQRWTTPLAGARLLAAQVRKQHTSRLLKRRSSDGDRGGGSAAQVSSDDMSMCWVATTMLHVLRIVAACMRCYQRDQCVLNSRNGGMHWSAAHISARVQCGVVVLICCSKVLEFTFATLTKYILLTLLELQRSCSLHRSTGSILIARLNC